MKINTAAAIVVFFLPAAFASAQDGPVAALEARQVGGPTTIASLVARSDDGLAELVPRLEKMKKKPCGNKFTCTVDNFFPTGIPKRDAGVAELAPRQARTQKKPCSNKVSCAVRDFFGDTIP